MPYRPKWHKLKIHRNYTVAEAALTLGVCRATIRRWIKVKGLPVIDDRKPILLLARDLIAFGKTQRRPKQKLDLNEAYCLPCRSPKNPAFGQMEIVHANAKTINVRMKCPTCSTMMHKRLAWCDMSRVSPFAHLTASQAHRHLIETYAPCLNVHFKKDG